jgi:hypothetical protein
VLPKLTRPVETGTADDVDESEDANTMDDNDTTARTRESFPSRRRRGGISDLSTRNQNREQVLWQ